MVGEFAKLYRVAPNYAFERPGLPSARARVRLSQPLPPSTRLKRLRPVAQRERWAVCWWFDGVRFLCDDAPCTLRSWAT